MPTRNVVLTDHHESVIEALVGSGRYQDASDVLREGLRLVEQREALEAAKLKALQDAAAIGFDDLDAGRFRGVRVTRCQSLSPRWAPLLGAAPELLTFAIRPKSKRLYRQREFST